MATKLKMYYNPYLCKVNLSILDDNECEVSLDGTAKDKIDMLYNERFCLEDDGEKLFDIICDSYRGAEISIEFVGTEDSFKKAEDICKSRDIYLILSKKHRILSVSEINKKIIDKVKQLKEFGYDVDSNGEIDKILDATIPVVVVGGMSAGKSTFLNSLIGEEILPSGQNRTTGVNCALHNSINSCRVEFSIKGNRIVIDCNDNGSSNGVSYLPEGLSEEIAKSELPYERVRAVVDFFNYKDKDNDIDRTLIIDEKLIDIYCPFYNKDIPEEIVFYDTPGEDSDTFQDDIDTLKKALEDQTKGFLVFVCAERKDLDKGQGIIDLIQEATDNKLDLPHTVVICNHTEEKPDVSVETSTEKEWASRIIYATSAVALGARKKKNCAGEWKEEKICTVYKKNREAFGNPEDEFFISLPMYCSLPENRKEGWEKEYSELLEEVKQNNDEQVQRRFISYNTGISIAENEICFIARELFPYNQCERARKVFLKLLEEYKCQIEKMESEKEEQRSKRIAEFNSIYRPLCNELTTLTEEYIPIAQKEFVGRVNQSDYRWTSKKSGDFATHVKETFLSKEQYSSNDEEKIRENIVGKLDKDLGTFLKLINLDFNDFLTEEALPDYASRSKNVIYKQTSLTESEKEVFSNFFSQKKLVDKTSGERREAIKEVKLDLPKLQKKVSGEKWYVALWKDIENTGQEVGYWFNKNFGRITGNLMGFYDAEYTKYTQSTLKQTENIIKDIMSSIIVAFSDSSADDNIICELNPQLGDIKRLIGQLNKEIEELNNRKKRIEGELTELNNIFCPFSE